MSASLIRLLMLGDDPDPKHQSHEKGVRIAGAWIPDVLDLEGCRISRDILLANCRFDLTPILLSSSMEGLFLNGSILLGVLGDRLKTRGGVFLRGIKATGTIRLAGAEIGGSLECEGAELRAEKDRHGNLLAALAADAVTSCGHVVLRKVRAVGEVRLLGASVRGDLDCSGARFTAVRFASGKQGYALSADRVKVGGSFFLRNIKSKGEIHILGAKIDGSLSCYNGRIRAKKDKNGNYSFAFSGDSVEVRGSALFREFRSTGDIRLPSAVIGGDVNFRHSIIEGTLDGSGNRSASLVAEGLNAKGSIFLTNASLQGGISFPSVIVGRNFDCRGAHDGLNAGIDLDVKGSRIEGDLYLPSQDKPGGAMALSGAYARVIDCGPTALATPVNVWLNRFEYDGMVGDAVNMPVENWLAFLAKQYRHGDPADFYPQPYEQLAGVLRKAGHGEDARAVLIEKERRQRAARLTRAPLETRARLRLSDWVLWHTVRHGQQPLRAALWLCAFWAIGTVIFFSASDAGAIKPNNAFTLRQSEWTECAPLEGRERLTCFEGRAASYPEFNALIYSADTLLPIVSLEMQEYWIPDDSQGVGWFARGYLWVHIAVGWALSLLAVAGFSGLVKSD